MRILLIGVGNAFRSDDGAGLYIARRIAEQKLPNVAVIEESGEGVALMHRWNDADAVILVDAVSSGSTPGTVHRFDPQDQSIPSKFFNASTHSFGLAEAIELARALNTLPRHLVVYGIEGKHFDAGTTITNEIKQTAISIVKDIVAEIDVFQHLFAQENYHA